MARAIGMGTAHRSAAAILGTCTARGRSSDARTSGGDCALLPCAPEVADAVCRIERSEPGGDMHGAALQPERYRLQLRSWIKVISHFGPLKTPS
jgi:hypothetical protein